MEEVSFGDNADKDPLLVEHRKAALICLQQQTCDVDQHCCRPDRRE
jgi:hypothetical protein